MGRPIFGIVCSTEKKSIDMAEKLMVDYVDLHFRHECEAELVASLELCEKKGICYVLNVEGAPLDWIPSPFLQEVLKNSSCFLGMMLDECDHMQMNADWPVVSYYGYQGQPFFAQTHGLSFQEAQDTIKEAMKKRKQMLTIGRKDVAAEYLYPGMMHMAGEAGLSASPKILKETYGPVMIAVGLGASLQYGGTFGIDVDAWWHPESVGHSSERFYSALLLAYWSGAERIYVEGGFADGNHPVQREILKCYQTFITEYVPEHPREYTWEDYQPNISIIRFDDTCFDVRQRYPGYYPGLLFGSMKAEKPNTEWLNILNLLSHGYVRNDSASHNWESRSIAARTLFAPLNGLAVFDHKVPYQYLASSKLIFLCGEMIASETRDAVQRRVKEGAVCVAHQRLIQDYRIEPGDEFICVDDGYGKWIILEDYYSIHYETWTSGIQNPELRELLSEFIGNGEQLIYDFGNHCIEIELEKSGEGFTQSCRDIPRIVTDKEDVFSVKVVDKRS